MAKNLVRLILAAIILYGGYFLTYYSIRGMSIADYDSEVVQTLSIIVFSALYFPVLKKATLKHFGIGALVAIIYIALYLVAVVSLPVNMSNLLYNHSALILTTITFITGVVYWGYIDLVHTIYTKVKPYLRILAAIVIIYCGIKAVIQEWGGHKWGIFAPTEYIPHIVLFTITIVSLIIDIIYHKRKKKIADYSISIIGLLFSIIILYKIAQCIITDYSKTIYRVRFRHEKCFDIIEFKENERFRYRVNYFLYSDTYYGTYSINNDTLRILESNYHKKRDSLPAFGVIKNDTIYWNSWHPMNVDKFNKHDSRLYRIRQR